MYKLSDIFKVLETLFQALICMPIENHVYLSSVKIIVSTLYLLLVGNNEETLFNITCKVEVKERSRPFKNLIRLPWRYSFYK